MDLLGFAKGVAEDVAIESLCKKSKSFAASSKIRSILDFMATNKIELSSEQGKQCLLDLNSAVKEFNQVFIEHGLDPQLSINCKKAEGMQG